MLVQTLNRIAKSQFEPDLLNTMCNEHHSDPWSQLFQHIHRKKISSGFFHEWILPREAPLSKKSTIIPGSCW